ncbi:unnamed protein product [Symbiodinium sp. CCMP2456]|nr:unnamed protein product [Symbiodinium sp. CCMP2456]
MTNPTGSSMLQDIRFDALMQRKIVSLSPTVVTCGCLVARETACSLEAHKSFLQSSNSKVIPAVRLVSWAGGKKNKDEEDPPHCRFFRVYQLACLAMAYGSCNESPMLSISVCFAGEQSSLARSSRTRLVSLVMQNACSRALCLDGSDKRAGK